MDRVAEQVDRQLGFFTVFPVDAPDRVAEFVQPGLDFPDLVSIGTVIDRPVIVVIGRGFRSRFGRSRRDGRRRRRRSGYCRSGFKHPAPVFRELIPVQHVTLHTGGGCQACRRRIGSHLSGKQIHHSHIVRCIRQGQRFAGDGQIRRFRYRFVRKGGGVSVPAPRLNQPSVVHDGGCPHDIGRKADFFHIIKIYAVGRRGDGFFRNRLSVQQQLSVFVCFQRRLFQRLSFRFGYDPAAGAVCLYRDDLIVSAQADQFIPHNPDQVADFHGQLGDRPVGALQKQIVFFSDPSGCFSVRNGRRRACGCAQQAY